MGKPFVLAITGNIGCGKSFVAKEFEHHGARRVSADEIAHSLLEQGTPTYGSILMRFGTSICDQNGDIDRRELGRLVFGDEGAKSALEAIMHPAIRQEFNRQLEILRADGAHFVVYEIPLYFEVGADVPLVDKVLTVYAPEERCVARVMRRNNLDRENAQRRYDSQMPIEVKCERSDYVIDNSGSLAELQHAVSQLVDRIERERGVTLSP